MKALKIDENLNDLEMVNGQFVWVDGIEEVAQEIRSVFKTLYGEWFLDPLHGVKYKEILGHKFDEERTIQVMYEGIEQIDRVEEVLTIEVDYDRRKRKTSVFYRVRVDGQVVEGSEVI